MNELIDFEYLKFQYEKELHPVFGSVLDTFPNIKVAKVDEQIYLWDVLQRIKYGLAIHIAPDTYLTNKYVDGKKNIVYEALKTDLNAICYNATFKRYKNTDNLNAITNLMFLDIDGFSSMQEALNYKAEIVAKYKWILACNLSLSKQGLHIIAFVDSITNSTDYTEKYKFISSRYFEGRLDKSSNKLTQFTVLPADYDIYINEHPEVLPIDQLNKKSIRSAYKENDDAGNVEKGLGSSYNNKLGCIDDIEKGIRSIHKRREIICTPHTFFRDSTLNDTMNDAARKYKLKFRFDVNESLFTDPNVPIYVREGLDVMEVNLFSLKGRKIYDGRRHDFIGALTVRLLYLNANNQENLQNKNSGVREAILKFIKHINIKVCEPPMTNDEVIKSYNSNWKRYSNGEMDFSKYFVKQRAFWSKHATLKGNEKRKVTCKIKNEPIVEESKRRIYEAIEALMATDDIITQECVEKASGMSLSTVKKYWKDFKEIVKDHNSPIRDKARNDKKSKSETHQKQEISPTENLNPMKESIEKTIPDNTIEIKEIQNVEMIDFDEDVLVIGEELKTTQNNINLNQIFERIFSIQLQRFDDKQSKKHFEIFTKHVNDLPEPDVKLLSIEIDDINDSMTFFRQSILDSRIHASVLAEYQKIEVNLLQ
jgi:hypothetical protein